MLKNFGQMLGRRKSFQTAVQESEKKHLNRVLGPVDVIAIGLGQIIGAGIFVLTGVAAKELAGPAVIFSYTFAGIACVFSALCYAEFAARAPISGSAYSYSYTVAGELMAWIIGWDLTLEYTVAAATVARGWSGYLVSFFQGFDVHVPKALYAIDVGFAVLDPISAVILLILTIILCFGVKDSSRFNLVLVILTVIVIFMVIVAGCFYVDTKNWSPFLPFGVPGIFAGASVVFFSYIGFDAVTTMAEEMKNPKRDLPLGIIGSLALSLILYVSVAAILTLMVPFAEIEVTSPIASAFANYGIKWIEVVISVGAFAALTTTILNSMLGQSRIYFAMSRDGLLWPIVAKVHPKWKTPYIAQIITGVFAIVLALFFNIDTLAEMVSIGTLLAFTIVCASIMYLHYHNDETKALNVGFRSTIIWLFALLGTSLLTSFSVVREWHVALSVIFGVLTFVCVVMFFVIKKSSNASIMDTHKISFVCPLVPIVPMLGIFANVYMMANLPLITWVRLLIWLFLGFVIYFSYSMWHSKLRYGSTSMEGLPKASFIELEEDDRSINSEEEKLRSTSSRDDDEEDDLVEHHHVGLDPVENDNGEETNHKMEYGRL